MVLSVLCDDGHPACDNYFPIGIALLGDREMLFSDFMEELREIRPDHYHIGMRSLGVIGYSADVSRNRFEEGIGEPPLTFESML